MAQYEPPKDIWRVNSALQLSEPLDGAKDPRWVDTYSARGEASLRNIAQALGVDAAWEALREPPTQGYYLFCGHRGSGKSTELRHLRNEFDSRNLYSVVFADAAVELDVHNLRYQDILLHLAAKLAQRLADAGANVDRRHWEPLHDWFVERVESREETKQFASESKAGVEGTVGIPLLAKVFGHISTAFKTNSSYKAELRLTLQNYFADFAAAFNQLVATAERELEQRLLFVVDGTDRLHTEDAKALFVSDVNQLQQVKGLFIYCAPVHLAYEGEVAQNFDMVFHLPMIKVENEDGSPNEEGLSAMAEMLLRRADASLFDTDTPDELAKACGGHPRDLLRLLQYTFLRAEEGRFSANSARLAVKDLSSDYRRILRPDDYRLLAGVDAGAEVDSDRLFHLLYNLTLLEYNNYFRRSHPVVRTTEEYRRAAERIAPQTVQVSKAQ